MEEERVAHGARDGEERERESSMEREREREQHGWQDNKGGVPIMV